MDEEMLFHWYGNKGVDISQLNADDFSRVAEHFGRTETACKQKICCMLRDGLASDEKSGFIIMWSKKYLITMQKFQQSSG
jgi:hypothetical protein